MGTKSRNYTEGRCNMVTFDSLLRALSDTKSLTRQTSEALEKSHDYGAAMDYLDSITTIVELQLKEARYDN